MTYLVKRVAQALENRQRGRYPDDYLADATTAIDIVMEEAAKWHERKVREYEQSRKTADVNSQWTSADRCSHFVQAAHAESVDHFRAMKEKP